MFNDGKDDKLKVHSKDDHEDNLEPHSKDEDDLEHHSKDEDVLEPHSKDEDNLEPHSKDEDNLELHSKDEDNLELLSKDEDKVAHECPVSFIPGVKMAPPQGLLVLYKLIKKNFAALEIVFAICEQHDTGERSRAIMVLLFLLRGNHFFHAERLLNIHLCSYLV